MKGISRYNAQGYKDPTAHDALTKVLREQRQAAKAENIRSAARQHPYRRTGKSKEVGNGQKP